MKTKQITKTVTDAEIISIEINEEGAFAVMSFKNHSEGLAINNFNDHCYIPIIFRPIRKSSRGNSYVDQSVKEDGTNASIIEDHDSLNTKRSKLGYPEIKTDKT